MVKRGFILIFLLLLIMPLSYAALTVTLGEPAGAVSINSSVTFSCSAASDNSFLALIILYFGTELTWDQNISTGVTGLTNSTSFVVNGIHNGNFMWNCKAVDSLNAESFGLTNNSFSVNVPPPTPPKVNTPPTLKSSISQRKWYNENVLNLILQDYFEDVDNDTLTFTVTGNSNINITIQDGYVTLTPPASWVGTETVIFTANDGNASTPSNEVLLNVSQRSPTNQPPILMQNSPSTSIYSPVNIGEVFSVVVNDPENDAISYTWKLDNVLVGNGSSFALNSINLGNHTLIVKYGDDVNFGNFTWTLVVEAPLQMQTNNVPVNANNQNAQTNRLVAKPIVSVSLCGNSKKDINENCENCPKDAPCDSRFDCVAGGKCQKKSVLTLIVTILFIVMAFLTAGYFSYEFLLKDKIARLFMKKEVQPTKTEVESIQKAVRAPALEPIKPDFLVQ